MTTLLDSVILIDHLNAIDEATTFLAQTADDSCISVITRAEVLAGADDAHRPIVTALLDSFPTLPIHAQDADLAASLRTQHRWKLPDAFQAALALRHGLTLATRNTRDFDPDLHPFVLVPYRLT